MRWVKPADGAWHPGVTEAHKITGRTRLFAIAGDPVAQVRAPTAFNAHFRAHGIDAVLIPLRVRSDDLETAMAGFRAIGNLDGVIITVPHKFAFLDLVDEVRETGRRVGAINAIRREDDGHWSGDMFDGDGFLGGLIAEGLDPRGKSALIVGAGGAGHAIAFALIKGGVTRLVLSDLNAEKARGLADRVGRFQPDLPVSCGSPAPEGIDLIVNATPLGMQPDDPLPIDTQQLVPAQVVAEVIMTPARTRLLDEAEKRGCRTQPGRFMLDHMLPPIAEFFGVAGTEGD